eukprot:5448666-Lingulodinium_polyedra.AAC.1
MRHAAAIAALLLPLIFPPSTLTHITPLFIHCARGVVECECGSVSDVCIVGECGGVCGVGTWRCGDGGACVCGG